MAGALISTTIPNLINGVSQQPYALRLASQAEVQENAYSSVVEGLRKRSGTTHRALLSSAPAGNLFTHVINRDASERYLVLVGNGDLKVYDLATGIEKVVNFPNGKSYLSASDPASSFKAVTIADYTFIVNKSLTVTEDLTTTAPNIPEALIWVKQGAYGTKYSVNLAGTEYSITTPDGSTAAHINSIQTDKIAADLIAAMNVSPGPQDTYTFARSGSSIRIRRKDSADFGVSTSDSQGDQALKLVKGSVQRFSDLPAKAFDGFWCEIAGDQSSAFDNYYVKYMTDGSAMSGVWVETLKGGEKIKLSGSTMPSALVREADGSFTFKDIAWEDRKTGDLDSNPMPSFVGKKINDIFFHRNRLGFVADENVIFSRAGEFFNFFRSSATQVVDTDPIDIAVSHIKVSILQHAIPFNESLLLFSEQTQFMLGAAELLTPDTVSINQTTEFDCSLMARPVGAGKNIYFAFNRGFNSGIREYYVDGDTQTNDAIDVTSHTPAYVPSDVVKMAASPAEDVLVMISSKQKNVVYVYKYYWNQSEKLQSSWSKWVFPASTTILSVDFIESTLYLTIRRGDGVFIESMPINPGVADTDFDFGLHLDRKVTEASCTVSYDSETEETTIIVPWAVQADETYQIVTRLGNAKRKMGEIIQFTRSGNVFTVKGDVSKFFIGVQFTMKYRFSTFVLKEEAVGGGEITVGEGRIQLRKASLTYAESGYFRVEVTPYRRNPYIYTFSGRVVGSARNVIGQIATESGRVSFPIMSKNDQVTIDLINDSYLPSAFLSAEWEALYVIRSKRI